MITELHVNDLRMMIFVLVFLVVVMILERIWKEKQVIAERRQMREQLERQIYWRRNTDPIDAARLS